MAISPISFMAAPAQTSKAQSVQAQPVVQSADKKGESLTEQLEKEGIKLPKFTPVQSGLINAVSWFGFGFLFDRLFGTIFKSFKTPLKLSLMINGAIGLIAGGMSYIKTKKASLNTDNK